MAQININIPNDKAARIAAAIMFPKTEYTNAEGLAAVKNFLITTLRGQVRAHEGRLVANLAVQNLTDIVDIT